MRARDLAQPYPLVSIDAPVLEAARLLADHDLPGLIVVDGSGRPVAILPGTQVLRLAVPHYCIEDPTLARVIDESSADVFLRELAGRTVRDGIEGDRGDELPVVRPDATVLEVAALMARAHSPVVAVVDQGAVLGAVTLAVLLDRVVPTA